jgi:hypothetical protein
MSDKAEIEKIRAHWFKLMTPDLRSRLSSRERPYTAAEQRARKDILTLLAALDAATAEKEAVIALSVKVSLLAIAEALKKMSEDVQFEEMSGKNALRVACLAICEEVENGTIATATAEIVRSVKP